MLIVWEEEWDLGDRINFPIIKFIAIVEEREREILCFYLCLSTVLGVEWENPFTWVQNSKPWIEDKSPNTWIRKLLTWPL